MFASDISRVAMSPLLLVATVLVVELAAAAVTDQPSQITDEELKSINKVNDLDTKCVTIICIGLENNSACIILPESPSAAASSSRPRLPGSCPSPPSTSSTPPSPPPSVPRRRRSGSSSSATPS